MYEMTNPGLRGREPGGGFPRSGLARSGQAPLAFSIVNRFRIAVLYGRAGRLAKMAVPGPGSCEAAPAREQCRRRLGGGAAAA
jgi:hypothetical protein